LKTYLVLAGVVAATAMGCSDPEQARLKQTTRPTYDKTTGKLTELTYDANKNGRIDTWTDMDGSRPVRSRIDSDEDGTIDRWEYYDASGRLAKVGFSSRKDGRVDSWAFAGADGGIARIEVSSTGDEQKIDRWEFYTNGVLESVAMDENGDGKPDRKLSYANGALAVIESDPDPAGAFRKRVAVK
jgi:hypothetical protein